MNIKIIDNKIAESELREIAKDFYGEMVKGVVDIEREILAMGGEYHMDANVVLGENGSKQQDVWGFNWYFGSELISKPLPNRVARSFQKLQGATRG